mmetsp:Transcript_4871/g.22332  ORF Transcript_4871/g.22332 Transcript_4871/m.22332 type:complete len:299 (-) Transcript_4871:190-1086(-)
MGATVQLRGFLFEPFLQRVRPASRLSRHRALSLQKPVGRAELLVLGAHGSLHHAGHVVHLLLREVGGLGELLGDGRDRAGERRLTEPSHAHLLRRARVCRRRRPRRDLVGETRPRRPGAGRGGGLVRDGGHRQGTAGGFRGGLLPGRVRGGRRRRAKRGQTRRQERVCSLPAHRRNRTLGLHGQPGQSAREGGEGLIEPRAHSHVVYESVGFRWRVRDEEHRAPRRAELDVDAATLHIGSAVEVGGGHRGAPHVRQGDRRPGLAIGLVSSDLNGIAGCVRLEPSALPSLQVLGSLQHP